MPRTRASIPYRIATLLRAERAGFRRRCRCDGAVRCAEVVDRVVAAAEAVYGAIGRSPARVVEDDIQNRLNGQQLECGDAERKHG